MRFGYDPEHHEWRKSTRGLLADVASDATHRRDIDEGRGWSREVWHRLCAELEVVGLAVPEKYEGTGFGFVELGVALFAVEADAAGVQVDVLETVDPTRSIATVTLTGVLGTFVDVEGAAPVSAARDRFAVLLAAETTGLADSALDSATRYARERAQFGRPIGSFQAIKHKLANVLLEVESARAAALYAEYCADHRPEELSHAAVVADSVCVEAAMLAAGENVQVHGGIGMIWEHTAHLYLKRATVDRVLLREPREHLTYLAELTGIS